MGIFNSQQNVTTYARCYIAKDGSTFWIRPARLTDSQEIERNIIAICKEQEYLHTDTFVFTGEWEALLAQSFDVEKRQILLVAVVNERIVGHARLFPLWFGSKGSHVANLGIAILKSWREIGIGTVLVNCLIEQAIRFNYLKASVEVIATNQRAINLFHNFGFVEEGRRVNYIKINGTFRDEMLLGLDLANRDSCFFKFKEPFCIID